MYYVTKSKPSVYPWRSYFLTKVVVMNFTELKYKSRDMMQFD